MMKISRLWLLFGCIPWMWLVPSIQAEIVPARQIPIYAAKLGVEADMGSVNYDREKDRTRFTGTVLLPCRLLEVGFVRVETGETVEVTSLETGRWEARLANTGEVKEFDLSIDWTKDG